MPSKAPQRAETVQTLSRPPFGTFAGTISESAGEKDFAELDWLPRLLSTISERSTAGGKMWMFAGDYGEGKTWTLSWLLRNGSARLEALGGGSWCILGFPLENSAQPDRAFFEGFFRSASRERGTILEHTRSQSLLSPPQDSFTRAIRQILPDPGSWKVLTGVSTSFPTRGKTTKLPSWSSPANRWLLFKAFLKELRAAGCTHFLILLDEVEVPLIGAAAAGRQKLGQFLRRLVDEIQPDERIPSIQVILSVSGTAATELEPGRDTDVQTTRSGAVPIALISRLGAPFRIPRFTKEEADLVAKQRIGSARGGTAQRPYIPFEVRAVDLAYENCKGQVRTFCKLLEGMYERALSAKTKTVSEDLAKKTIRELSGAMVDSASASARARSRTTR